MRILMMVDICGILTPQRKDSDSERSRMARVREREEGQTGGGGGGGGVPAPLGQAISDQRGGVLSLDPELYHVVKKLKDAKNKDVSRGRVSPAPLYRDTTA